MWDWFIGETSNLIDGPLGQKSRKNNENKGFAKIK